MDPTLWKLFAIVLCIVSNGFFVAAEFALVSVRRSRLEELARQGVRSARRVERAVEDLGPYIACTQVGITLASLGLGWIGEPTVARMLEAPLQVLPENFRHGATHAIAIVLALGILTFFHVLLGELVPKCVALQKTEATALLLIRPLAFALLVFRPLIWALSGAGNALLRLMGLDPAGKLHSVHSVEELEIIVGHSHEAGVLDEFEREMVEHSLGFSELTAKDVMIPRLDMRALDINLPTEQLLDQAAQTIHTRFPVYDETIDHIIGILHLQDLYKQIRSSPQELNVRQLLRPPLVVPETVHLDSLIEQFRQAKSQIAVVIDEHGGIAGLVTLEDVVEEVFGEMHDALEAEQPQIQRAPDGRIVVRGDVRLDEVRDDCGWQLEDPDADTIAGFVMKHLGRTARVGDKVDVEAGTIRVENMARHRITQVALLARPQVGAEASAADDRSIAR